MKSTVINNLQWKGGARSQATLSHAQPPPAAARTIRTSKPLTLLKRYRRLRALLGQINTWGRQYAHTVKKCEAAERNRDGFHLTICWRMSPSVPRLAVLTPFCVCVYMHTHTPENTRINEQETSWKRILIKGMRGNWMVWWKWCESYTLAYTATKL